MKRNIFVTGGVGFLGSFLVKELLRDRDNNLELLVRDKNGVSAKKRAGRLFKSKRIRIIKGDITKKNLGISKNIGRSLVKNIDIIYHCAALCNLVMPIEIMREINVEGTRAVLDFAVECRKKGRLREFNHVSTVAVAGKRKGVFYEDMLDEGQKFNNPYEQSKFEAEKLVTRYRKRGLDISIFRPSIVVGSSKSGEAMNLDMFYQFLKVLSHEIFDAIPAKRKSGLNLVPVDSVAKAICLIAKKKTKKNGTYNVVNSKNISLGFGLDVASKFFGFRKPELIPNGMYKYKLTNFQKRLLEPYIPYCNYRATFDSANLDRILKNNGFSWPRPDKKTLRTLFKYCVKTKYITVKN